MERGEKNNAKRKQMRKLKVIILCEESQAVTKAFRALGHEAYSCDLIPSSGGHPEWHIQGDAIKALYSTKWDLVIAHPPCTRLANSGVRWLASRKPKDGYTWSEKAKIWLRDDPKIWKELDAACKFFNQFILYGKTGGRITIENPIPHSYAMEELNHNKYHQIVQPYMFGHMERKATCLWLYNLPPLKETNNVYNEMIKLSKAEQNKVHYCSPGPDRAMIRSKTYTGVAAAIAEQYSEYVLNQI